jgi:hypothetical protein
MSTEATRPTGVNGESWSLADDLLRGAEEIACFIYRSPDESNRRRIYYASDKHGLPTFRLGGVMCARKSTILKWIADQEQMA